MRWLVAKPGTVFALFVGWKIALFLFTGQPVPFNDAYFYDGAVVNSLGGGAFVNPSIAIARPYSGTEFFSAYPLLYQGALFGWMKIFGTSVQVAVGFHVFLISIWTALVYLILKRLELPTWVMHLAGGFLFTITAHDRPDSLAHVLGAGAVLAMVGWLGAGRSRRPLWLSALLLALVFCASLQLGAVYTAVVGVTVVLRSWLGPAKLPWLPLLVMGLTPFVLLAIGKHGFPQWWTGFLENAQDNPSAPGLLMPDADKLLKLIRSLPGFLVVLLLSVPGWPRIRAGMREAYGPVLALFLGTAFGTLAVCGMGLFYLTANYIPIFAAYLQPLTVGTGLAWLVAANRLLVSRAVAISLCGICIGIGGLRAVGMTTWGLWCARDVSCADAGRIVTAELHASSTAAGRPVVLSSAYLYLAAPPTNLHLIHSDYVVRPQGRETQSDLVGLITLEPSRLLLTQFDFYRRYEPVLAELQRTRRDVTVHVTNTARVPAPEAERFTRKLIQHISWAPVIVELSWPTARESNTPLPSSIQ